MPTALVIAGPNGAGKSTMAPGLVDSVLGRAEFVNADRIARGFAVNEFQHVDFVAGRIFLERLRELGAGDNDFAFETTLSSRSLVPYLAGLRERGFRVVIAYVWPGSPDVSVARVQQRHLEGGHGIPEDVVRRRYKRSLSNFFELYVPLADEWIVLANREGVPSHVVADSKDPGRTVVYNGEEWASIRSVLLDDNV